MDQYEIPKMCKAGVVTKEGKDFEIDENGGLVDGLLAGIVAGTPAARSGVGMHSDAAASAKVRKDHEEGRLGGASVSTFTRCVSYG